LRLLLIFRHFGANWDFRSASRQAEKGETQRGSLYRSTVALTATDLNTGVRELLCGGAARLEQPTAASEAPHG
jgi:hypothetical protein